MLKKIGVFCIGVSFCLSTYGADLGENVQKFIESGRGVQKVFVKMKDVNSFSGSKTLKSLRENASVSQKDIMESLNSRSFNVDQHWSFNALALDADKELINELSKRADVETIFAVPEMELFGYRENFNNENGSTYSLKFMNTMKVWEDFGIDGNNVRVGVVDTGLNDSHNVFDGKVIAAKNFASDGNPSDYADKNGHGTHCSGTVLGGYANDTLNELVWGMFWQTIGPWEGNIGNAPGAKLLFGKVMKEDGTMDFNDILKAIEWCVDPDGNPETKDGARLVSLSLGSQESTPELREPIANIVEAGTLLIFAAGNHNGLVGSPADFPEVFTVGAIDSASNKASFSCYGPVTWDGVEYMKPDVVSGGVKVISYYGDKLSYLDGTSMACPNVAGAATLLFAAKPEITVKEAKEILRKTAVDLGDQGADKYFGWGRVDIYRAVAEATGKNLLKADLYTYDSMNNTLIEKAQVLSDTREAEESYLELVNRKDELVDRIVKKLENNKENLLICNEVAQQGIDLQEIFEILK